MADLVTAAEYKAWANITGTADDAAIAVMLPISSAVARRWCGRDETNGFNSAQRTLVLDGNGAATLQLTEWPVTAIESVSEIDDGGTSTALTSTDYRVNAKTGVLARVGSRTGRFASNVWGEVTSPGWGFEPCWTDGFQNWSIVYTGGWATIPADLKGAVYEITDWCMGTAGSNPGLSSESIGAYSYTRLAKSDDQKAAMVRAALSMFTTGGL